LSVDGGQGTTCVSEAEVAVSLDLVGDPGRAKASTTSLKP